MNALIEQCVQTLGSGLAVGCIYGLMCVGLAFIFGIMHVINFAQADFMMIGMYLAIAIGGSLLPATLVGSLSPFIAALLTAPIMYVGGYLINRYLVSRTTGGLTTKELLPMEIARALASRPIAQWRNGEPVAVYPPEAAFAKPVWSKQ